MPIEFYVTLSVLFCLMWLVTLFLLLFFQYKSKPKKELTLEARDLLQDILTSGAVIRLEILDPKNLMYHRG